MSNNDLAIYIHWPFCEQKCPYCDFNSYVLDDIDTPAWLNAYINALTFTSKQVGKANISSIYFGGGTPSLMPNEIILAIFNYLHKHFSVKNDIEITIESNPSSFEINKFKELKDIGFNRLSLGVQSFEEQDLKTLGRIHSKQEALNAIQAGVEIFNNVNFDLIYGRNAQTLGDWQQELKEASQFFNNHVSLYQLTIEKGTQFFKDKVKTAAENEAIAIFDWTVEFMESLNFQHYEVSNFAKQGFESKHNINYWNYGNWLGIGAGAHSRLFVDGQRVAQNDKPFFKTWLEANHLNGEHIQSSSILDAEEQKIEAITMGLRHRLGVDKKWLNKQADTQKLASLKDEGYVCISDSRVSLTPAGIKRLDSIIEFLVL